ncbi:hypothetical protein IFM89_035255 [Coptis chinensis]|uniref:Pectinesterase inhibitor domain-containing protein n=1 Tax=Coptis chinensis TaxID=261450 RepID=A0A835GZF6_9MAGN|nr:hypothetical protein IFM89_035255 [Coptis chinensis]
MVLHATTYHLPLPESALPLQEISSKKHAKSVQQCHHARLSFNFCKSSLEEVVPHKGSLSVQELGIIALELATINATNTVTSIQKMLTRKTFGPHASLCLKDCLELYSDVIPTLSDSVRALVNNNEYTANIMISAAMEAATTCQDGFEEEEGEVRPLVNDNNDFFQLCDIALVITSLVSATPMLLTGK